MSQPCPLRLVTLTPGSEPSTRRLDVAGLAALLGGVQARQMLEQGPLAGQLAEGVLQGGRIRAFVLCSGDSGELQRQYRQYYAGAAPAPTEEPVERRLAYARAATDPQLLLRLARDARSRRVRQAVASNPYAPPAALSALAGDPEPQVRQALCTRSDLPLALWRRLASDPDCLPALCDNPRLPSEIATQVLLAALGGRYEYRALANVSAFSEPMLLRHIDCVSDDRLLMLPPARETILSHPRWQRELARRLDARPWHFAQLLQLLNIAEHTELFDALERQADVITVPTQQQLLRDQLHDRRHELGC